MNSDTSSTCKIDRITIISRFTPTLTLKSHPLTKSTLWLLLSLACATANSEPTNSIKYLITEPASMMDIGLLRLNIDLRNKKELGHAGTSYDWDKNKLNLIFIPQDILEDQGAAKQWCQETFSKVRTMFLVDIDASKTHENRRASSFGRYFTHKGYASKKQPADLLHDIDDIVELTAIVYHQNTTLECNGPLVSNKTYISIPDKTE